MKIEDYERIFPTATIENIRFHTPNSGCLWRVQTLLTKEPDTIAWIRSLPAGDTFFDVGANMGQYSLIAAQRGLTVHAFEPDSQNFALLCRNIALNADLAPRITAWPLALSDRTGFTEFHAIALQYGSSCHSCGTERDFNGNEKKFAFTHGAYTALLDEFARDRGAWPNHIKIDVDGLEPQVVNGIGLYRPELRSMLVELNTHRPDHMAIFKQMADAGFEYDEAQAVASRRTEGPFAGIGNVTFWRRT